MSLPSSPKWAALFGLVSHPAIPFVPSPTFLGPCLESHLPEVSLLLILNSQLPPPHSFFGVTLSLVPVSPPTVTQLLTWCPAHAADMPWQIPGAGEDGCKVAPASGLHSPPSAHGSLLDLSTPAHSRCPIKACSFLLSSCPPSSASGTSFRTLYYK